LIIKLGYSETLDPEIGGYTSLGDVLRTTPILHCFKNDHITWLVDESAYPLLKNNSFINRILFYNLTTVLQLQEEQFDIVINLEKVPGICALAGNIKAWLRFGYRFDSALGEARSYENSHNAFQVYNDLENKKQARHIWQEILFEMIGQKWHGEKYIFAERPKTNNNIIGLNYLIGRKWPSKAWPRKKWDDLSKLLEKNGYEISWQDGRNDLETYIDWVNRCNVIITADSLGLHLAIALQKNIIALFGPTLEHEVYLYDLGYKILPDATYDCIPCLKNQCREKVPCMDTISIETVFKKIKEITWWGKLQSLKS